MSWFSRKKQTTPAGIAELYTEPVRLLALEASISHREAWSVIQILTSDSKAGRAFDDYQWKLCMSELREMGI